jgi:hypothetical protein
MAGRRGCTFAPTRKAKEQVMADHLKNKGTRIPEASVDHDANHSPEEGYSYDGSRPRCEPVQDKITDPAGRTLAVRTLNALGCLVMNALGVLFLDIDLADAQSWPLFRSNRVAAPLTGQEAIASAYTWVEAHPEWAIRIYGTCAGFRLVALHDVFEPEQAMSCGIAEALGVDPRYRRLCTLQGCFRARLSPKPERVGLPRPTQRWPFQTASDERAFARWQKRYAKLSAGYATCALVATIGRAPVHPDVARILDVHDEATKALSGLPLA